MSEKLLEVHNFKVSFYQEKVKLQVVRGVDLFLRKGEMIGIVGESGSGKSVSVSSFIKLQDESSCIIDEGTVFFEGDNLVELSEKRLNYIRGKRIAYIFQNPAQALNPYKRIGKQLEGVLKNHRQANSYHVISEALKEVGIDSPDTVYNMYPFQLSGGQNQRIMIALCILSKPDILIADEPTSSIDASLRKKILDLLIEVNKKYQMSIILITHDFDVAKYLCQRIHIMYGGLIVEEGSLEEIFDKPLHPYTNELIKCAKSLDLGDDQIYSLEGSPITPNEFRDECPFYLRCNKRMERCLENLPPIRNIEGRKVRCKLYEGSQSYG
ncbi:MAG: ABC transporter ATP-binding protein [Vallitaleaceae bacterium]|nr:ABC transporter ATP-binding protein [Vallitaleaceae bacterium]